MPEQNKLTLEKLEISSRLSKMEAKFDEFKEAHHREATERQDNIVSKLDKIFCWFEKLPCDIHATKIENLEKDFTATKDFGRQIILYMVLAALASGVLGYVIGK